MDRRTFALALVPALAGLKPADIEVKVSITLKCSLCRRIGEDKGHVLILAEEYYNAMGNAGNLKWGFCEKCYKIVKRALPEFMLRLAAQRRAAP